MIVVGGLSIVPVPNSSLLLPLETVTWNLLGPFSSLIGCVPALLSCLPTAYEPAEARPQACPQTPDWTARGSEGLGMGREPAHGCHGQMAVLLPLFPANFFQALSCPSPHKTRQHFPG